MTLTAAESEHSGRCTTTIDTTCRSCWFRQVAIITEFAAHYETLEDVAPQALTDSREAARIRVRLVVKRPARYLKWFAKVLPGTKLARYFQIENRLFNMRNLNTASRIPLAH